MKRMAILLILVFSLSLTACGVSRDPSDTVSSAGTKAGSEISGEITLFTYRNDLVNTWYPKVIREFNAQYPNVIVKLATSTNFSHDLKIKIAARDVPDLTTLPGESLNPSIVKEYFMPLNQFSFAGDWTGNRIFEINGTPYALTYGLTNQGLIYNKAVFDKLHMKPPHTLDALIKTAETIKTSGKIGYAGISKVGWTYFTYNALASALSGDKQKMEQTMLNEAKPFQKDNPYVKIFQMVNTIRKADILEKDTASYGWDRFKSDFQNGNIGMYYGQSSMLTQLEGPGFTQQDFGFIPYPYDNSGGPYIVPYSADWGLAISRYTQYPQAAKALFTFLMNKKYKEYAQKTGVFSARKGVSWNYPYLNSFESQDFKKVFLGPDLPNYQRFLNKADISMTSQFYQIGKGQKTPQQIIENLNQIWSHQQRTTK